MSTQYQPGEIVDIAIKGVRVHEHNADNRLLSVEVTPFGDLRHRLPLASNVTVTRRAPAEWPPQTGDVWRDRNGDAWFARQDMAESGNVAMYPSTAGLDILLPDELLDVTALTLVYREGWAPSEPEVESTSAQVDERDFRERFAAGLRELAEYVEAHPEMPLPHWPSITGALNNADEISRAAYALVVDEQREVVNSSGKTHWRAERDFGPFKVRFSHVEDPAS